MQTLRNLTPLLAVAVLNVTFGQTGEASDQTVAPAPDRKPLVLVAGATGKTGSIVVAELQARGFPVRAFVRDAAKATERLGPEVEAVVGDLKDMASIVAALDGVGAVINAAGSGVPAPADNTPEKVDFEGARNLAEAAMDAGVDQYVLVSSQGATHDDHPLNKMFNNVLIWKRKGEEALAASGVAYTIVRPGGLSDGPGGVKAIDFQQGDNSAQGDAISRADVARVCVAALEHEDARNKVFEIQARDAEPQTDFAAEFAALAGS